MAVIKTLIGVALLAISVQARDPTCLTGSRGAPYNKAQTVTKDGRIYSLCYNAGGSASNAATLDQAWIWDVDAILQRRVNGGACCIDCLPTAQGDGCTGSSGIGDIDGCIIGKSSPPPLTQAEKDIFLDLLKDLVYKNTKIKPLDGSGYYSPAFTIDKASNGVREVTYNVFGKKDKC